MFRPPRAAPLVIAALFLTVPGCKNHDTGSDPTAVVNKTKTQMKSDLMSAAHPNYRGDTPGNLKGALLLIEPLSRLLGVQQIAVQTGNGKRFLNIRCTDGVLHLEVAGEMAVNGQPGFLIGDVSED